MPGEKARGAERIKQIEETINDLVEEYWGLINPTEKEVQEAKEQLTADPLNDLPVLVHLEDRVSKLLILDEVIANREIDEAYECVKEKRSGAPGKEEGNDI